MLGKASEVNIIVFSEVNEYHDWQIDNLNAEIIDIKFSTVPQNSDFQSSFGVLVIYKEES